MSVSDGSPMINSAFTMRFTPNPLQVGQAPNGELNEK